MTRFPKQWRKISLRTLDTLYRSGNVIFHHPYKLFCLIHPLQPEGQPECRIIISVPKRNIKRAVGRNRIKRQIRESFRLHFNKLHQTLITHRVQIELLCLYVPNEHTPTSILSDKMESLLARVSRAVTQVGTPASLGVD